MNAILKIFFFIMISGVLYHPDIFDVMPPQNIKIKNMLIIEEVYSCLL